MVTDASHHDVQLTRGYKIIFLSHLHRLSTECEIFIHYNRQKNTTQAVKHRKHNVVPSPMIR